MHKRKPQFFILPTATRDIIVRDRQLLLAKTLSLIIHPLSDASAAGERLLAGAAVRLPVWD